MCQKTISSAYLLPRVPTQCGCTTGRRGRFLEVNEAAVAAYGYSRADFMKMTVLDIRPPEDIPVLRQTDPPRPIGQSTAEKWRHKTKNGTVVAVFITSWGTDLPRATGGTRACPMGTSEEGARGVDVVHPKCRQDSSRHGCYDSTVRIALLTSLFRSYDPSAGIFSLHAPALSVLALGRVTSGRQTC